VAWTAAILGFPVVSLAAGDTAYAVQAWATVQNNPAEIRLSWTPGSIAVNSYAISRKEAGATSWSPLVNLVGSATSHTDLNVTPGRLYEYQIVRQAANLTGYGYVAAAVDLPVVDSRGTVILVVDNSIASALSGEIDQWVADLVGDGWTVARRDVGRGDSPAAVRDTIRAAYNEDRANARAVFLLGHVPVVRAGNLNVDGHGARPLPADAFYGDMDGAWPDANGDGVLDPSRLPSDLELAVGRVDFADMPGFPDETTLLRRYLKKNHEFRHGLRRVTARALVGDATGDFGGEAFGASGFRTFPALLGPDRLTAANTEDNAPAGERWISRLTATDWLWVYGSGSGDVTTIGGLGLRGAFDEVWSVDLVEGARGMFYLLFGSWLVEWNKPGNILRAALAAPDYGLASAWSGRPHLFFHRMALGETTGDAIRLSQNNTTLYASQVNRETRGIHISLMGDPTLRMHAVAPPSGLRASGEGGAPTLSWTASPDATVGYHVYRSTSGSGPFSRVTSSPVGGTTFTDTSAPAGQLTYQVKAVRREISGGGTYFNLSQAASTSASVTTPATGGPSPSPSPTPGTGAPGGGGGSSGGGGAPSLWFVALLSVLGILRLRSRLT
jgi:hypothetical protein